MKKLPIVHAIIPAFVVFGAANGAICGCGHTRERGDETAIEGFLAVPIATGGPGGDRDGSAGFPFDAAVSAADASATLEPVPPAGVACQTVVACRAEADVLDPRAVTKDLPRCSPTDVSRGELSARETREGRARGVDVCCYVRFAGCI